jgi:hypothetical protein
MFCSKLSCQYDIHGYLLMSELEEAIDKVDDETLLQIIRGMKPPLQEKMKDFLKEKYPPICKRLEQAQETHLERVLLSMLRNAKQK